MALFGCVLLIVSVFCVVSGQEETTTTFELPITSRARPLVCSAPCGFPTITIGGIELYIHTSYRASWFEAVTLCEANGLKLLSIETEEKNNIIKRVLAGQPQNTAFWTSGNDIEEEGKFIWHSTKQNATFFDWAQTKLGPEPQNLLDSEHCIFIGPWEKQRAVFWYDAHCPLKYFFVCEFSNN